MFIVTLSALVLSFAFMIIAVYGLVRSWLMWRQMAGDDDDV